MLFRWDLHANIDADFAVWTTAKFLSMQILHEQKLAKTCIELDDGKQGLQISSKQ